MGKLRSSGGYRQLRTFQIATTIYDATYWFCERFVSSQRMADQMVQAARSGRQNIAEGSRASGTSTHSELRLTNVARSSLEELLLDYEDYLRHRGLRRWQMDDPETKAVRTIGRERASQDDGGARPVPEDLYALYAKWLDHEDPGIRANCALCLIHQANYLLDRQIETLEQAFVEEGGYTEQLAAARVSHRSMKPSEKPSPTDRTDRNHAPPCPKCGSATALRTARSGKLAGKEFWGCTAYPECKGVAQVPLTERAS